MKPKILAVLPGLIPSTIIGVITPLLDLHREKKIIARIALETTVREKDVEWSDLVILCRNIDPLVARWFFQLPKYVKPYIYDIDDNFFEIPLDSHLGRYCRAPERQAMLMEYITRANLVRVYSQPMFDRVKELNMNVVRISGPVDLRLLKTAKRPVEKKVVRIVYATSRVNDTLAEIFKPALERILEKYSDRVEVYFLGYNPPEFKSYPNVFFRKLNLNYEQYLQYFSSAGFDIGLAPLLDDVFHRSKTNLKVREYGACRIAGIYSNVDVYSSSVISGSTGLLVENNSDDWFDAMSTLIENRELREHIGEKAYQFVSANYSHTLFDQVWYEQIMQVVHQPCIVNGKLDVLEKLIYLNGRVSSSPEVNQKMPSNDLTVGFDQNGTWLHKLLFRKIFFLISGIQAEGFDFLLRTLKIKFEAFWMMLRIRLIIFFS